MNINQWTPEMHESRIAMLRVQYINVKNSRHLSPAIKAEKLKVIARKGKSHATRLKGFNATVVQQTSVVESFADSPRYNGSIAWGSMIS